MASKNDIDGLLQALNSTNSIVRVEAITALGNLKEARAVEPLIIFVNGSNVSDKLCSITALGKIGSPQAIPYLLNAQNSNNTPINNRADEAIKQIGRKGLYYLIQATASHNNDVAHSALTYIRLCMPSSIDALIESLKDPNDEVRANCAFILAELTDIKAVEPLIQALKDHSSKVRINAVKSLERYGDIRAVQPLMDTLKDNDADVRNAAALALRKFNVQTIGKEREVVHQIVKMPCKYCGTLIENTSTNCPSCGAPLNPFR
jgi:HEAT repeat protein